MLQLVESLNKLLGTNLQPVHAEPRAGDVRFSKAILARTRRDLGYVPDVTFDEGLKQTLAWYRSNEPPIPK